MTQNLSDRHNTPTNPLKQSPFLILVMLFCTVIALNFLLERKQQPVPITSISPPLVMTGGDPYIRALMRTISASEATGENPYVLLYGGDHTHDLSQHPDRCLTIQTEVNQGHCSTAAGRYQFLTTTWQEKAARYHPDAGHRHHGDRYSFEPQYQDAVTYHWLKDEQQWQMDIAAELKNGNLDQVLQRLSKTWTSLGYGIEDNAMTATLPQIYQDLLAEELKRSQSLAQRF